MILSAVFRVCFLITVCINICICAYVLYIYSLCINQINNSFATEDTPSQKLTPRRATSTRYFLPNRGWVRSFISVPEVAWGA